MKLYNVLLHKIESTHNNMRTDTIEGKTGIMPEVGKHFTMLAQPLDPKLVNNPEAFRLFNTSEIKEVDIYSVPGMDVYTFKTMNSTYSLHVDTEDYVESKEKR